MQKPGRAKNELCIATRWMTDVTLTRVFVVHEPTIVTIATPTPRQSPRRGRQWWPSTQHLTGVVRLDGSRRFNCSNWKYSDERPCHAAFSKPGTKHTCSISAGISNCMLAEAQARNARKAICIVAPSRFPTPRVKASWLTMTTFTMMRKNTKCVSSCSTLRTPATQPQRSREEQLKAL